MKTKTNKIALCTLYMVPLYIVLVFGFASCDLDYYPSDEQSSDVIMKEASSAVMDGCYALMKDEVEYLGWPSGNSYCRHYFQLAEFPADNTCVSGKSTDPLFQAATYTMTDNLQNVGTLWMLAYKIIYMANTVIEALDEANAEDRQIVGEAYFVRALIHHNLVTLFAMPYSYGTSNKGIPLRTSSISGETKRNTVGEVYDQIVEDLKKAASLMSNEPRLSGNYGYPTKDAALGLLSRVYLFMGNYTDCINTVDKMMGGSATPAALDGKLDHNFASYFANAKTSSETLFCIAHEATEDRGQSSIGSMYNAEGGGWGEIYPSFPLLNLYERYPTDVRYTAFIKPQYKSGTPSEKESVYLPKGNAGSEDMRSVATFNATKDESGNYTFTSGGTTYTLVNKGGEYTEYHVDYKGEDLIVRVMPSNMIARNSHPKFFVTKFGYQDGSPTLSSPVVLRWGEVILNAAEAYARNGNADKALVLVDVIRHRAGIPDAGLFTDGNTVTNMHGYTDAIDVVMDERRMELAFEGHRMFDVYRNQKDMDRHYPGFQQWNTVSHLDNHIVYPIPNGEWTVSHIEQNPGY